MVKCISSLSEVDVQTRKGFNRSTKYNFKDSRQSFPPSLRNRSWRIITLHNFLSERLKFSNVRMWELDYKESWAPKNWCFWSVVLEKTLESPLDCKEIQPVHPKGNQSWIVIGRTDAEAETPILWPLDPKNWLTRKDPDTGKDWSWEEKGTTKDEMVGWHHWLYGYELE